MAEWDFPITKGSESGFSHGAIDTFAGTRLSSLVREVIQNSLDAVKDRSEPVTVYFSLEKFKKAELVDLDSLALHFDQCYIEAESQGVEKAIDFFKKGKELLSSNDDVSMLIISDSNTNGLWGSLDASKDPWFALVMSDGLSQKSAGGLGSYGHGSKAPFSMTNLRTVYYLTKTMDNGNEQKRFQGKSILQSHPYPSDTQEKTEAVGFYSNKKPNGKPMPMLDDEIPSWALSTRQKHSDDLGTTIFVPYTSYGPNLFPETKITVIANFYYAIKEGNLNVEVNGDLISASNVDAEFERCKEMLPNEQELIDVEYVKEAFKAIDGIINNTSSGDEEIPEFGRIKWHMCVDENISTRRVSIARNAGMLITRRPKDLKVFANKKSFELFVYVDKGDGYDALTKLENPQHDNFEFDRVQGVSGERKIKGLYNKLTKRIKEIIEEHAGITAEDEITITELEQLMFDLSDGNQNENTKDRGAHIKISAGVKRIQSPPAGTTSAAGRTTKEGGNRGERPGAGGGRNPRGEYPGRGGRATDVPRGDEGVTGGVAKLSAENLRIVHRDKSSNNATIYFDAYRPGTYNLKLLKVGETDQQDKEAVLLKADGQDVSQIVVKIEESGRFNRSVTFSNSDDFEYALEGWLDEIQ